jgi:hypothetical protein
MQLMGNLFFKSQGQKFSADQKNSGLGQSRILNSVGSFKLIQAVHLQGGEVELATWTSLFGNVDFKNLAKCSWQTRKVHWEI